MDEREKRIDRMSAKLLEAVASMFEDKENPNYLGDEVDKFEFMVALNITTTTIYNALGAEGGKLTLLEANYLSNKVIVQYLMRYGKINQKPLKKK